MNPRRAWIAGTGDELVEGRLADTNGAFLARHLEAAGWDVRRLVTVGDRLADLVAVVREAAAAADLLVITGGLGNTDDDLTRQAVAAAAGVPLAESAEAVAMIEAFYRRLDRPRREGALVEALLPQGAAAIPNPVGLAPGIDARVGDLRVVALPGVPAEMRAMIRHAVPELEHPDTRLSVELRLVGLAESEAAARLGAMMARDRDPLIGIGCKEGWLELVARTRRGDDPAAARARLERDLDRMRQLFGARVASVAGREPAALLADELIAAGRTVAVAESLTGGLVTHLLTETPGVSAVVRGAVVAYAVEAKRTLLDVPAGLLDGEGPVSAACALAMARGVRARFGADLGLATTGVAGPGPDDAGRPQGLAFVAVAGEGVARVEQRMHPGERAQVKSRTAQHLIDLARRVLDASRDG